MGKGEIARFAQFILFPQCFYKTYPAITEKGLVCERVKAFADHKFHSPILALEQHKKYKNSRLDIIETMNVESGVAHKPIKCHFLKSNLNKVNTVGKGENASYTRFLLFL